MKVRSNYMDLQLRTITATSNALNIGGFWRQRWPFKVVRCWWTNRNVMKVHFLMNQIEDDYRHLMEYKERKKNR